MGQITHVLKKSLSISLKTILIALLIIVFMVVIQGVNNPNQPPSILGYKPLVILSNSMNPTFSTGDLVVVKSISPSDVKEDDVITFMTNDQTLVTHRVVNVKGSQGFITKGDNNNVQDEDIVKPDEIIGKQMYDIKNIGYLASYIRSPLGILLLVLFPLIGYIGITLYERKKKIS